MAHSIVVRGRRAVLPTVLVAAAIVSASSPAPAAAEPLCTVTRQITSGPDSDQSPTLSADGTRVAYTSSQNTTGMNADANYELFVDDLTDGSTIQVTVTDDGGIDEPVISADGTHVAFVSSSTDLSDTNFDGNEEIFVADVDQSTLTQVTTTAGGNNNEPAISGDGSVVAFTSVNDISGGNADLSQEVFLHSGATTTQVTSATEGVSGAASIADDGTRLAFYSTSDLVGGSPEGDIELFEYEQAGHGTTQLTSQVDGSLGGLVMSGDGSQIVYSSNRDDGDNPDRHLQLYRYSTVSGQHVRIASAAATYIPYAVSTDGSRAVAISDAAVDGGNPDGNVEVRLVDVPSSTDRQLTETTEAAPIGAPTISGAGTRVVIPLFQDPLGQNPGLANELFLSSCGASTPVFSDVPTTNPFFDQIQWMVAAEVASGYPDGTFRPLDGVKRQQMANFMYNLAGRPAFTAPSTPTFTDVPPSNPFYAQIEWMAAEDVASGFPDGTFRPLDGVKRQQMANFMYNLAGRPAFTAPSTPTFTDVPPSNPFYAQIEWMAAEEVASGFPNGTFRPRDVVKRQQMANFMYNFAAGVGVGV